jgi:hypothetical protein
MVSSDTSRSTRRRCSPARDGGLDPRDGAEGAGGVVGQDRRQPGQQPGHVLGAAGRAAHQLGPEDVEAALEQAPQVGDVGLLGLGLLAAGPQLGQAEPLDLLGEARVQHPVDAAMAAGNNLHAHPSPPVAWHERDRL